MKRLIAAAGCLTCVLLVAFSRPAAEAAQKGLDLWWNTVLPGLFPFFVCTTLLQRMGILQALAQRVQRRSKSGKTSPYALPVVFLGAVSGYPCGARLCGTLQQSGCISDGEAQYLGTVSNLCSPMFLITVASGLLKNDALFFALAIGHYLSAVCAALLLKLCFPLEKTKKTPVKPVQTESFCRVLPESISDGIFGLIRVGGSIVFFLVLVQVLREVGVLHLLSLPLDVLLQVFGLGTSLGEGVLTGLFEMTGGCFTVAQGASLRSAAALCSFLVSFGGICVMVQAMSFMRYEKPWRYVAAKFLQGIIAAILTWTTTPWFLPQDVATMAQGMHDYVVNTVSGAAILLASCLGAGVALLVAILIGNRHPIDRMAAGKAK